jgi:ribonuclease R
MISEKRFYGITIDGANTLDIDDAIWCEKAEDGNFLVTVYVTGAAEAVPIGSDLDKHAFALGSSRYSGSGAVEPMLPLHLSEKSGALIPNAHRTALAVRFLFDARNLDLINSRILILPFCSLGRYTFQEAAVFAIATDRREISEWEKEKQIFPQLGKIAEALARKRRAAGAVCRAAYSEGWAINDDLQLIRLDITERNIGYLIVEEFSILANRVLGKAALKNNIPFLFLNHRFSGEEKKLEEKAFGKQLAVEAKNYIDSARNITSRSLAVLFKRIQAGIAPGRPFYSVENKGHAGLALSIYGHSSAPLRRYADLVNQRQLFAFLRGGRLPHDLADLQRISAHLNKLARSGREEYNELAAEKSQPKRIRIIKKSRLDTDSRCEH